MTISCNINLLQDFGLSSKKIKLCLRDLSEVLEVLLIRSRIKDVGSGSGFGSATKTATDHHIIAVVLGLKGLDILPAVQEKMLVC